MVSGFLISPYDHDRIFSGLAIEIRIWSKTCAGTCGLKRFIISWFIVVSVWSLDRFYASSASRGAWRTAGDPRLPCPPPHLDLCHPALNPGIESPGYSAASAVPSVRPCLELCRSTLRPRER